MVTSGCTGILPLPLAHCARSRSVRMTEGKGAILARPSMAALHQESQTDPTPGAAPGVFFFLCRGDAKRKPCRAFVRRVCTTAFGRAEGCVCFQFPGLTALGSIIAPPWGLIGFLPFNRSFRTRAQARSPLGLGCLNLKSHHGDTEARRTAKSGKGRFA